MSLQYNTNRCTLLSNVSIIFLLNVLLYLFIFMKYIFMDHMTSWISL